MDKRIKIFIVEYDCVNLITLMLWLDQFSDFDVLGTTLETGSIKSQIEAMKPDVVLLDIGRPGPEDVSRLRDIKTAQQAPAVLILYQGLKEQLRGPLDNESDGSLGPESTLGELRDAILASLKGKEIAIPSTIVPIAKAG
jgi:DNA-binding NarL/FixJ family response regulator